MTVHQERAHAVLSASGAHRWMNCTPSARLEEQFPNKDTSYSQEGTKAHEMAESLLTAWMAKDFKGRPSDECIEDKEMFIEVMPYVEYVAETYLAAKTESTDAVLFLEQKLDMNFMIENGFGTGDAVIVYGSKLHIIDLKFGKGVKVDAANNEQLKCYGIAAYELFAELYEDIDTIQMTIVQPRIDHISSVSESLTNLQTWVCHEVIPKAKLAYEGKGDYHPGSHCRFCKAGGACKARTEENLELAKKEFTCPDLIEVTKIADIIAKAEQIVNWVESVKTYALDKAMRGDSIPGYKLVEGRSIRKYVNEDDVIQTLKNHEFKEALLFEPKKVLGISKMQKLLGKKLFKEYLEDSSLVIKPKGKLTLVVESDKRKAVTPDAIKDFEGVENELL